MTTERVAEIREVLVESLGDESEDVLCASFRVASAETPWVQVIPGCLNVFWPWSDDEPLARLLDAVPGLRDGVEVGDFEHGTFATFEIDEESPDRWAEIVDACFRHLHGCPEGNDLEVEVYPLQDDEIPELVPITREAGYHTDTIGTFDGGQFMAFVVATLPDDHGENDGAAKRWYAVLHRFSAEGAHLGTEAEFVGTTADGEEAVVERATRRKQEMIAGLGEVTYEDVAVELFVTDVDGHEFGLVDASYEDEESGEVFIIAELRPNELIFFPPWDGTYDT